MDDNKAIYETNYSRATFALGGDRYTQAMQAIRFELIERYGRDRDVLDVGCATGDYLKATWGQFKSATGLDYTQRFLDEFAASLGDDKPANLRLVCADARDMPFAPASFDLAYSFATLYAVPEADRVVAELGRVVRPGGTVILEFGNLTSLNTLVAESWHKAEGWAKPHHARLSDIRRWLTDAGFAIEHWRSFQVLPLYAVPRRLFWAKPFSGVPLRSVLSTRLSGGRILDELICGAPGLKQLAFRHLVVAQRCRPA